MFKLDHKLTVFKGIRIFISSQCSLTVHCEPCMYVASVYMEIDGTIRVLVLHMPGPQKIVEVLTLRPNSKSVPRPLPAYVKHVLVLSY